MAMDRRLNGRVTSGAANIARAVAWFLVPDRLSTQLRSHSGGHGTIRARMRHAAGHGTEIGVIHLSLSATRAPYEVAGNESTVVHSRALARPGARWENARALYAPRQVVAGHRAAVHDQAETARQLASTPAPSRNRARPPRPLN